MTFLELAQKTLESSGKPLSGDEIWEEATVLGFIEELRSYGKTPVKTLTSQLYVDIRDNNESIFLKCDIRPVKFFLKDKKITESIKQPKPLEKSSYKERDLHQLLTNFVYFDSHFKCYTKTVFHEKSKKGRKGEFEWLHPDVVGIYYPFSDYSEKPLNLMKNLNNSLLKLFSFELKKEVEFSTLREYYFQAVSNSSWANEGYLVALKYEDSTDLFEEMVRLANAFGIGFIKLNANNIEQSEIIVPAKPKDIIDWDTLNKLVETNPDFKAFISNVVDDSTTTIARIRKEDYDEVLSEENLLNYVKEKKIQ